MKKNGNKRSAVRRFLPPLVLEAAGLGLTLLYGLGYAPRVGVLALGSALALAAAVWLLLAMGRGSEA